MTEVDEDRLSEVIREEDIARYTEAMEAAMRDLDRSSAYKVLAEEC